MTVGSVTRPEPSALRQLWVLTARVIAPTLRNGELLLAISLAAAFTASFYIPLKGVMAGVVPGSYAQYLMPAIVLQTVYFAAMSAALRSAIDKVDGVNRRFGAMPIPVMAPLAARMAGNTYRCVVGLATAILCGYVIGFRFHGGVGLTLGFCILALLIGITLALVGDLIGMVSSNPEATSYIILLPVLTLGMVSVGFQPAEQFPEWIQGFVRNQVHSQFVSALRALAGDATQATAAQPWAALAWVAGILLIVVPLYARVLSRRR